MADRVVNASQERDGQRQLARPVSRRAECAATPPRDGRRRL